MVSIDKNKLLLKEAERIVSLVKGDKEGSQVERLAQQLITELKNEATRNEIGKLKERLSRMDENLDNDGFLEDGSIGQIWSLAMAADREAEEFRQSVISSWRSHYQKSLSRYRDAIKKLSYRWGFGDDITSMLRFVFVESRCLLPVWSSPMIDFNLEGAGYESPLLQGLKLKASQCECYEYDLEDRMEDLIAEDDGKTEPMCLPDVVLGDGEWGVENGYLICQAVYLCFHPDLLRVVSDGEIVMCVLFGFLNGATNNDAAIIYARLKKKVLDLEGSLEEK